MQENNQGEEAYINNLKKNFFKKKKKRQCQFKYKLYLEHTKLSSGCFQVCTTKLWR